MDNPSVRFVYFGCTDLAAMRHFYTELVGLRETYHADGPDGSLAYDCDGLQFTIMVTEQPTANEADWSKQPGWGGGLGARASWSVVCSAATFPVVVRRLIDAGVSTYYEKPRWHGYWGFPVKDPMGNTVEVTLPLEEPPAETEWAWN
jgi:catechol 2,3-dioxygenase-like lactoylglutathione lyase family enzyme